MRLIQKLIHSPIPVALFFARLFFYLSSSLPIYRFTYPPSTLLPYSPFALLAALLFLFPSPSLAQAPVQRAQTIVDSLASPYFAGRGYGGNEDSLAAAYIGSEYQLAGLSPLLETYYQHFSLQVSLHEETPLLALNGQALQLGIDFLPYDASPSMVITNHTRIVFAGSGLILPNEGINEYLGIDPREAIVVIRDAGPDSIRTNPDIPAAYLSRPIRTAIAARLGASAVLFITDSPLAYGGGSRPVQIPAFLIHKDAWPDEITSVDLSITSKLQVPVTTSNVIGYQEGTEFPRQFIVLMGHYDHLGKIGPDYFFPGANDNASGIALMLNVASHFKNNPQPYSLLYIAFSGEEQGLLGSHHFVQQSPVPLDSIRFLINLDMVASGNGGLVALGGNEFPEEYELLKTINDSLELGPIRKRSNAPNSDHYFFLKEGVRGFFLYTDKGTQPYHHINDLPETLNWKEYEDTFQLVKHFIEGFPSRGKPTSAP